MPTYFDTISYDDAEVTLETSFYVVRHFARYCIRALPSVTHFEHLARDPLSQSTYYWSIHTAKLLQRIAVDQECRDIIFPGDKLTTTVIPQ